MNFRIITQHETLNRADFPNKVLWFFDFDGVLATQCEEKLFRLPEDRDERVVLEEIADEVGIRSELYGTQYLRHLLFQTVCQEAVEAHTITDFARSLRDPYFVMTARSGHQAIERMLEFVEQQDLQPQEVFCLGRQPKASLISLLLDEWPDHEIVFIDDSQKHIDGALALNHPRLHVVQVIWDSCTANAERLRSENLGA